MLEECSNIAELFLVTVNPMLLSCDKDSYVRALSLVTRTPKSAVSCDKDSYQLLS